MPTSSTPNGEVSAVDRIAEELRERIRRGQLVGGQRLIEADWTRELQVSRGPVREAFGRLAAEGLVIVERKRGAVVRRLNTKDILDLYEARAAIEGQAAAAAARCVGAADNRTRLEQVLHEHQRFLDGGEFSHYLGVNENFHRVILEIADNDILQRLGRQLHVMAYHLQTTRVSRATTPVPLLSVADSARFHCDITEAVLAGKSEQAERLMREHLMTTRDGILEVDRRGE
ncbi:GntR family transcriptional regulator [Sciscionella marina]|uniref:GntR family transcriptional regulator n=1 Tax=Sciscionella marina TaxID=508770 RepID=UPI0009FDAE07|nr:GntR family transcriptional regulator [Sciscionella marina]